MSYYVKAGLIAGVSLAATLGLFVFGLNVDAFERLNPHILMAVSVGTSSLLVVAIAYGLWRGLRSGVVMVFRRPSVISLRRSKDPIQLWTSFRRSTDPLQYWFWFCSYIFLIPLILWLMFGRLRELQRRYRPPVPAYTQDSEDRYYGPRD